MGTPPPASPRSRRLPAVPCGMEPLTVWQHWDALLFAQAQIPGSQTLLKGEEHPGQLSAPLTLVRKAQACSSSKIAGSDVQAGHLLHSPFPVVLRKAIALKGEGELWGKRCCRNDSDFWLDLQGMVLGTAPLINFSGRGKGCFSPSGAICAHPGMNLLQLRMGATPY